MNLDHHAENEAAELPEHINQSIEYIRLLYAKNEVGLKKHQRLLETATVFFGQPGFFYGVLGFMIFWTVVNEVAFLTERINIDPYPFFLLQNVAGLVGLLLTIAILVTQNRQTKISEQQARLNLQVTLLTDQKISKIIALLEELRYDLPSVKNRYDSQAEAMKDSVDPHLVMEALEQSLVELTTQNTDEA